MLNQLQLLLCLPDVRGVQTRLYVAREFALFSLRHPALSTKELPLASLVFAATDPSLRYHSSIIDRATSVAHFRLLMNRHLPLQYEVQLVQVLDHK